MFTERINFLQKAVIFHPLEATFLILQRRKNEVERTGEWDLPGGNVKFGEVHLDAIRREIREETGLGVIELQVAQVATGFNQERQLYHLFIGYSCKAEHTQVQLGEHEGCRWVTEKEAQGLLPGYLLELVNELSR
ncbi:MAG: NUDIX domain-containing protein [Trueperaceae bacterium]